TPAGLRDAGIEFANRIKPHALQIGLGDNQIALDPGGDGKVKVDDRENMTRRPQWSCCQGKCTVLTAATVTYDAHGGGSWDTEDSDMSGGAGAPALGVQVRQQDAVAVVEVTGEVDTSTAHILYESLLQAIEGGPSILVADLGAVDFMDSAGLAV